MTIVIMIVLAVLGAAVTPELTRNWTAPERRFAYWSLAAHLVSAPAQELVYRKFYGDGDMLYYVRFGEFISELCWRDPGDMLPEVARLLFQQDHRLPMHVLGEGTSTGSMCAISALLGLLVGASLTTQGALIGLLSFTGKCASHTVFRRGLAPEAQRVIAVAQLLVPTSVFWSSALLKESVIAGTVGWLIFALSRLLQDRNLGKLPLGMLCAAWIGLFKPYLLVGFAMGAGAWVYVSRAGEGAHVRTVRPLRLGVAFAASVLLVGAVGKLFPAYDVGEMGDRVAFLQEHAEVGGSSYALGDSAERSLIGQMAFAPIALVSTFFRPFIFEISSATAAVNAVEATAVLWIFVTAFRRRKVADLVDKVLSNPALAFAFVYSIVLAVGVGLATPNIGTLSRYRAPFYAVIVTLGAYWYLPQQWLARAHPSGRTRSQVDSRVSANKIEPTPSTPIEHGQG